MVPTLLLAVSGCGGGDTSESPTGEAGVPPADLLISPTGSDTGECRRVQPCAGFARAYEVAEDGDVVEVEAGVYPEQIIEPVPGKAPTSVRFQPEAGGTVTVDYLDVSAPDLEFRGFTTGGWYVRPFADGVTFRDVVATDATYVSGAHRVSIIGGEIRGVDSSDGLQVKPDTTTGRQVRKLLIDGLSVRDITRREDPAAHVECVQIMSAIDLVIRKMQATNCATQGVFLKEDLGGRIDRVLVENSVFGPCPGCSASLIFDHGVKNATARYNSFAHAPRLWRGVRNRNIRVVANVGILRTCGDGAEYRYNVWDSVVCGPTDLQAQPGFVDPGGLNLRLQPGAEARGHGDPDEAPPTDITGVARSADRPDAGAYESSQAPAG